MFCWDVIKSLLNDKDVYVLLNRKLYSVLKESGAGNMIWTQVKQKSKNKTTYFVSFSSFSSATADELFECV